MSTKGGRNKRSTGGGAAGKYKVGYGKPPEEWRFGADRQPAPPKRGAAKAQIPNVAGLLDQPMQVQLNGKQTKIHPHDAMLHGLFKRVAKGEIRAINLFLQECRRAGLLAPPPHDAPTGGVLAVPQDVPMDLAALLVNTAGPPPWDQDLYARLRAEYDRDCAHLEELKQEEITKARANGEEAY
jgi:hypothetical protein